MMTLREECARSSFLKTELTHYPQSAAVSLKLKLTSIVKLLCSKVLFYLQSINPDIEMIIGCVTRCLGFCSDSKDSFNILQIGVMNKTIEKTESTSG